MHAFIFILSSVGLDLILFVGPQEVQGIRPVNSLVPTIARRSLLGTWAAQVEIRIL